MIETALKYLNSLSKEACALERVPVHCDATKTTFYDRQKAEIVVLPREAEPREHVAGSIGSLVEFVAAYMDNDPEATPCAWCDESEIVAILDDSELRLNTISVTLKKSHAYAKLREIEAGQLWFDHKQFVRLLRIDLAGTIPPVVLLEPVRKIRFENGTITNSTQKRNEESLGREIIAKVSPEKDLPETVSLEFPVFTTSGASIPISVTCAVEVDAMAGRFQLLPLPDQLDAVRDLTLAKLVDELAGLLSDGVHVLCGSPS